MYRATEPAGIYAYTHSHAVVTAMITYSLLVYLSSSPSLVLYLSASPSLVPYLSGSPSVHHIWFSFPRVLYIVAEQQVKVDLTNSVLKPIPRPPPPIPCCVGLGWGVVGVVGVLRLRRGSVYSDSMRGMPDQPGLPGPTAAIGSTSLRHVCLRVFPDLSTRGNSGERAAVERSSASKRTGECAPRGRGGGSKTKQRKTKQKKI